MRRLIVSTAAFASLVMPALAQSESQPVKVTVDVARPDGGRGEQIEIFRRVLAGKLHRWQTHAFDAWCVQCHVPTTREATAAFHFLHSIPLNGAASATPDGNAGLWVDFGTRSPEYSDPLSIRRAGHPAPVRPAALEGVYLNGYGVVYTLTLPPAPRAPAAAAAPKPLSDWDRARLELRGEQPKLAEPLKLPEPSLTETVLRALFENGKHFTGLADNDRITVAATFRPELLTHPNDAVHQGLSSEPRPAAFGQKVSDAKKEAAANPTAQPYPVLQNYYLEITRANDDYEVLGDLMVRQGKVQEAIDAYKRALQANPAADRAAALHRKLAQALLQKDPEKNAAQAQEALAEAVKLQEGGNKAATAPKAGAAKIPEKLVITVPLGMLKTVAAGKMSFEEFSKAAHIEHMK